MNKMNKFITWYFNEFQTSDMYAAMADMTENSPHHRERNIGVHTNMVVASYISRIDATADKYDILGAFAACFHDVGKPSVCQFKRSDERGNYKSFKGHELASARMWEHWACENFAMISREFDLSEEDIYRVGFMIENHIPWSIKKTHKRLALATTLVHYGIEQVFCKLLLSDTYGRIADDQDNKRQSSDDWVVDFLRLCSAVPSMEDSNQTQLPKLFVPIAASGSGKSTNIKSLLQEHPDLLIYSMDTIRLELYGEPYSQAYTKSTEDPEFAKKCAEVFQQMINTGRPVYVDNTNLSQKRRRGLINAARQKAYNCIAIVFPVSINTIIQRQYTRVDKTVPNEAVLNQYQHLSLPRLGEFDSIVHNPISF